ncbi:MAG TPA: CinA family protein [Burkholderiaceae bacterium]|nr:CinA family protein [Burkholderiaceae bacterium]
MDTHDASLLVGTPALEALLAALARGLQARGWRLAVAESCTGGLIAATCTSVAGSSLWFERGFVTYSNEAKTELLGVPRELIERHGAVSREVALAMAAGALRHSGAQLAVAVTGIAGPDGGSATKPVGTVWFGFACKGEQNILEAEQALLPGDRGQVRSAATMHALARLAALVPGVTG